MSEFESYCMLLKPQPYTLPSSVIASECLKPQAILVTLAGMLIETGLRCLSSKKGATACLFWPP